jgi:bifunctional UDP-N-acetylglucosamine pyrophosphorylase/glucosamine-1-phosphate N-acetyltransferase
VKKRPITAVVLAAGEGTRMKSSLPKVLHPICGRPMLLVLLDTLKEMKTDRVIVVAGHGADQVRETLGTGIEVVLQEERLGTGHAMMVAGESFGPADENVLVLAGDIPLITTSTLKAFTDRFIHTGARAAVLTMQLDDPAGYGRVVRGSDGEIARIVEERDASEAEKMINEVNTSIYLFKRQELLDCLGELDNANRKKEYYLTDAVEKMLARDLPVTTLPMADSAEAMGINTRSQLAEAGRILRSRINRRFMDEGVTVVDPYQTYIDLGVSIGRDTVIQPLTFLTGATRIGEGCLIGPSARIADSTLGNRVTVQESVVRESVIEDGASVGPYASLRPGTRMKRGAKAGTFVEIKNTVVGRKSKVPHLSYIGDAVIGEEVNVGAGSITCNYDGAEKHATTIDDGAFIGSDTMLIAPVRIGKGAVTGAGSAISRDVPAAALGVERAPQKNIENWKKKKTGSTKKIKKPVLPDDAGATE